MLEISKMDIMWFYFRKKIWIYVFWRIISDSEKVYGWIIVLVKEILFCFKYEEW